MTEKKVKKVVLAYSGGLDTSIIIPWLIDNYACEVIAYTANLGQGDELRGLEAKAMKTGAKKIYIEDLREKFINEYIFPTMKAGAIYERKYLLGTSFARPIIAKHMIEIAEKENADAVSHGCTGKGNDQVRFELAFKALNPKFKVIAPWREWDIKSRKDAIKYAHEKNIPITASLEKIYSEDKNIWHTSHEGGELENPWNASDNDMLEEIIPQEKAKDEPEIIEIDFLKGIPIGINGQAYNPVELLSKANEITGEPGEKIHTGLSRNDLIVTEVKMYLKSEIDEMISNICNLQKTSLSLAKREKTTFPLHDVTLFQSGTGQNKARKLQTEYGFDAFGFRFFRRNNIACRQKQTCKYPWIFQSFEKQY